MYLKIIEDYQNVISGSNCSDVILGLSEIVRDLMCTYKKEIDNEIQERKKNQQIEIYISHLRETERILLSELESERDMVTVSDRNIREELENVRSQINQAIWPTHTHQDEIAFLRGDIELLASYSEKLDARIDNQNEIIEDLTIKQKILTDNVNILDKKLV